MEFSARVADILDEYGDRAADMQLSFGGITFEPDALLYADPDGVVVLPR